MTMTIVRDLIPSQAPLIKRKCCYHRYSDEEIDIIRRDYRHSKESLRELAQRLGTTPASINGKVRLLGLSKRTDYRRRKWTEEEEKKLVKLLERHAPSSVPKFMGRSINSVVVKSKRLGVRRRNRNDWYVMREVCEILGVDHHWLRRRVDSGAIVATWHYDKEPGQRKGSLSWHFTQHAVCEFIRRYPEELNGRNVDMIQVVEILVGVLN